MKIVPVNGVKFFFLTTKQRLFYYVVQYICMYVCGECLIIITLQSYNKRLSLNTYTTRSYFGSDYKSNVSCICQA